VSQAYWAYKSYALFTWARSNCHVYISNNALFSVVGYFDFGVTPGLHVWA